MQVLISRLLSAPCSRLSSSRRSARSSHEAAAAGCTVPAAAAAAGCQTIRHRAGLRHSGRQRKRPPSQTSSRLASVKSGDSYQSFRVSLALKRKPSCWQASDLMHLSLVCAHRRLAQTAAASNSAWMLSCRPLLGMVCTPRACHAVASSVNLPHHMSPGVWQGLGQARGGGAGQDAAPDQELLPGGVRAVCCNIERVLVASRCASLPYCAPADSGQVLMWFRSHTRCLTSKSSAIHRA